MKQFINAVAVTTPTSRQPEDVVTRSREPQVPEEIPFRLCHGLVCTPLSSPLEQCDTLLIGNRYLCVSAIIR